MNFYTRKWIKPEDLNAHGTLFGGSLLRWIDEEAAIYTIIQLGTNRCVIKFISEINFVSSARQGDIIDRLLPFRKTVFSISFPPLKLKKGDRLLTAD